LLPPPSIPRKNATPQFYLGAFAVRRDVAPNPSPLGVYLFPDIGRGPMRSSTRRQFIQNTTAAAGAVAFSGAMHAQRMTPTVAVEPAISQFDYGDVELLAGPMRAQFDANHAFFLALDEDRLLKPYRLRAGLPAPGDDMGGWYDSTDDFDSQKNFHGFVPGHTFGQYLSALARAYAITGSKPTQEKVNSLVRAYAAAVSPKFYDGYHLPAYTYDKVVCGLIDAHQFAHDPIALETLNRATDAVLPWLPERALSRPEQRARPHKNEADTWDETYTLPENLFLAYRRGAGARYRDLAARFIQDKAYFDPLAAGLNVLPEEHAYSHVNALCSAMQSYLVVGNEKYLRAARNGFHMVQETQSFATGGWGPDERFRKPGSGELGESLSTSHAGFETPCGAYAHFKLTRYLLRVTGDSRYGDSMERVLYNTILGAKPLLPDGSSFYYSDYNMSARKTYHHDKWPCCSGTFPQVTADYGISSYFRGSNGIYVNLYVPSRLSWSQNGTRCRLTQETNYPHESHAELTLSLSRAEVFTVFLRIPEWSGGKTNVAINGKRVSPELQLGKFAALERNWRDGDRITVEFDMPMRLEPVDAQHPSLVALLHGPVTLFSVGDPPEKISRAELLSVKSEGAEWKVNAGGRESRFRDFASINDETYRLYQNVAL
jgi:DUF1680 family protein